MLGVIMLTAAESWGGMSRCTVHEGYPSFPESLATCVCISAHERVHAGCTLYYLLHGYLGRFFGTSVHLTAQVKERPMPSLF